MRTYNVIVSFIVDVFWRMPRCGATAVSGRRCRRDCQHDEKLCWQHLALLGAPVKNMKHVNDVALKVDDECSICMEGCEGGMTLRCGHMFHRECLRPWIEQGKDTCPLCRGAIDVKLRREISPNIVSNEMRAMQRIFMIRMLLAAADVELPLSA